MGDPTQHLPTCTIEDIWSELARVQFPEPLSIKSFSSTGSYHKIYRLIYSSERHDGILRSVGVVGRSTADSSEYASGRSEDIGTPGQASLVLRVSGNHIPAIKTSNEVAILAHLRKNTTVPVPAIIHHDLTRTNLLKNEYMITTFAPGQTGSDIYENLTQTQMSYILDQLATICLDLYKLKFTHIGGLKPNIDSHHTPFPQSLQHFEIEPGPPVLESMWQTPDIEKYFTNPRVDATATTTAPALVQPLEPSPVVAAAMTFDTLNAVSPNGYPTYTSWLAAQMTCYIRAIHSHPSLHWLYTHDPSLAALQAFTTHLTTNAALQSRLNTVPLHLVHGDLHFGNILLVPEPLPTTTTSSSLPLPSSSPSSPNTKPGSLQYRISAILDWEFANILPYPFWDAGFLYSSGGPPPGDKDAVASYDWAAARREKQRLQQTWRDKVRGLGGGDNAANDMLRDMKWQNEEQRRAWDVVNYLRCVVEVCPRDKQWEDARGWWKEVERGIRGFGIEIGGE